METIIGFDSAWTDNLKAPGAIAALCFGEGGHHVFYPPQLASFDEARAFIDRVSDPAGVTLVALDQPTLVPNATGMRPVERAAASLISWLGGGVQPSNTGRVGMFCAASSVWRFLSKLGAVEDPEGARAATQGRFIMEVFPAIALASFEASFFGRLAGPRYNPDRRKTFRADHWGQVARAAARQAESFGCADLAAWCRDVASIAQPRKADQDRLDAALCLLIAIHWRRGSREASILLGDLRSGYMVLPASADVRTRLSEAAARYGVPVDGR
jgi:predicted RNase H-like nuclease